jgi:hypothetical protein
VLLDGILTRVIAVKVGPEGGVVPLSARATVFRDAIERPEQFH